MSTKNARWGQQSAPQIVLAGRTIAAHQMFGGLTLAQIGQKYNLSDEDVKWGFGVNPQNQQEIRSLILTVEGTMYQIPLSKGLTAAHIDNPSVLLNCVCRTGFMSVKNANGDPETDDKGAIITDQSKPYMSLGRPSGLTISRMEAVFNEPVESTQDLTADANVAKQPPALAK